ncbi:hypothetical protein [Desulfobotulus alkaliphilus]|uniref:hypothetical protein n=1 Tax=Desulfobotulus alkaliphilus TaxID=622671 RepID=UPI0011A6204C|nr:hypothetical protein [Desulfobotulus alkaliphilus]
MGNAMPFKRHPDAAPVSHQRRPDFTLKASDAGVLANSVHFDQSYAGKCHGVSYAVQKSPKMAEYAHMLTETLFTTISRHLVTY